MLAVLTYGSCVELSSPPDVLHAGSSLTSHELNDHTSSRLPSQLHCLLVRLCNIRLSDYSASASRRSTPTAIPPAMDLVSQKSNWNAVQPTRSSTSDASLASYLQYFPVRSQAGGGARQGSPGRPGDPAVCGEPPFAARSGRSVDGDGSTFAQRSSFSGGMNPVRTVQWRGWFATSHTYYYSFEFGR